jgi:hypothetical protein
MTNDLKGEVRFESNGTAYKIRFTTNVLYEHLERALNISMGQAFDRLQEEGLDLGLLRQLLYAGLYESHRHDLDLQAVGELIDHLGIASTQTLLNEALVAAFSDADETDVKKKV